MDRKKLNVNMQEKEENGDKITKWLKFYRPKKLFQMKKK